MAVEIIDKESINHLTPNAYEQITHRTNYENACNAYLKAFCQKHGFSEAYWVADRVGEIADCNESYTFDMSTIRTDIDEDAPEEQLLEWHSYTEEATLFNTDAHAPLPRNCRS